MSTTIDGKTIARAIIKKLRARIKNDGLAPDLAAILIGDDEASKIYINAKRKMAGKIGIAFRLFAFPSDISEAVILQRIQTLNDDESVNGIIIQFPLPRSFDADKIISAIAASKDADGFHPKNIAAYLALPSLENVLEEPIPVPVTPVAVMEIIKDVKNRHPNPESLRRIVLVGKCSVFVEPLIRYFELERGGGFEVIAPDDPDLREKTRAADILIVAIGRPHIISEKMVREGAVVIDIGTSRVSGKIIGDVDFENVREKASFITPSIGGVGPVTVAVLMRNVVRASEKKL